MVNYTTEYELCNGIETLKFNSEKEACEFLGVRKSTVSKCFGEDVTYEGWIALALCILKGVPHDEAYELLDNPRKKRTWTDDMIEDLGALRAEGYDWKAIGEMYNVDKSTVCKVYNSWRRKKTNGRKRMVGKREV